MAVKPLKMWRTICIAIAVRPFILQMISGGEDWRFICIFHRWLGSKYHCCSYTITDGTNPGGYYLVVDPRLYGRITWEAPSFVNTGIFPENWAKIKEIGPVKLFFVPKK